MRIKEVLLGIIIGIVLLMFLVFGTKLIYDELDYEDYCDYERFSQKEILTDSEIQEQRSYYNQCEQTYKSENEEYSKKMFVLSLIVGLIIIIGSVIFIQVNSISGGLMLGSLMFIIYGTGSYWEYMNDWIRFIILGVALGILIYAGYWLGGKEKTTKKKGKR